MALFDKGSDHLTPLKFNCRHQEFQVSFNLSKPMRKIYLRNLLSLFICLFFFPISTVYSLSPPSLVNNGRGPLPKKGFLPKNAIVVVVGYGQIGSNVAAALRRDQIQVKVFDTDSTKQGEARDNGFETLDDLTAFLEPRRKEDSKSPPIVIADCTPNGVGANNKETIYSNYPGIKGVVFQGGEKPDTDVYSYSPELAPLKSGLEARTIRVQPCSINAMIKIFVPILKEFPDQEVHVFNRAVRDGQWKEDFEPYTLYHHGDTFRKQLALYGSQLNVHLTTHTISKSDLDGGYHWNYAQIETEGISKERVLNLLKSDDRLAVIELKEGFLYPDEIMAAYPEEGSGITAVQVVSLGMNKVGIYFVVPHLTNVVPPTLDAVHYLFGDNPEEGSFQRINKTERIPETKPHLEKTFNGKSFGPKEWLDKYQKADERREKLRIIKLVTIGGMPEKVADFINAIFRIETNSNLIEFAKQSLENFSFEELRSIEPILVIEQAV